jgi:tetratricopeptide (TPR) repeat protein
MRNSPSFAAVVAASMGLLLFVSVAICDVIILKDGTRIEGDLKRVGDGWTVTTADGKVRTLGADAVRSVQLGSASRGGPTAPPSSDAAALASLRRSVEALSDINEIIGRYTRFIEATKDQKLIDEARAEIATWKQRLEQGMVRHGSKWVLPEEVAALAAQATEKAMRARELIRQNRNREGELLLQEAIGIDPLNPAAQYLRGVVTYRQDRILDARRAFESVNTAAPSHPPTLNNLAVILWKQNAHTVALAYYEEAMLAAGVNDFILNNVAEALGTLPENQKKHAAVERCLRKFAELDTILQQQMAQRGLYRWGATWVDQKKLDELRIAEREIREKLLSLQTEFDQARARMTQIDQQINLNRQRAEEIKADYLIRMRDKDGNVPTLVALPQVYYDFLRENQDLESEQRTLQDKMARMQGEARSVRQRVPVPQFTGLQQIVGVEGMPVAQQGSPTGPVQSANEMDPQANGVDPREGGPTTAPATMPAEPLGGLPPIGSMQIEVLPPPATQPN